MNTLSFSGLGFNDLTVFVCRIHTHNGGVVLRDLQSDERKRH